MVWGRMRRSHARAPMAAVGLAVVATLLPVGWSAASGAAPAFSYQSIASVPIGTNEAQSVVVNDKLYLFGGFDVTKSTYTPTSRGWVYDPAGNTWTALPAMPVNGITHAGIATDGVRYIYYAGGNASADNATQQIFGSTDAFRYDTVSQAYTRLPSLPAPRSAGALAYVSGRLFYIGGNNLDRTVDPPDVWMLDVAGGATSWVSRAALPNPRNHLGWAVINGLIYVVGGQYFDRSDLAQADLDRYDPVADRWTVLAAMPFARSHVMDSTFVLDGMLVVAGGWTKTSVSAAVLAYDPESGAWTTWPDLPEARTSATAKSLSGGRFMFCCGSAGTSSSTGWMALPRTPPPAPPTTTPVAAPTTTPVAAPTTPVVARTTAPAVAATTSAPVAAQPTAAPTSSAVPVQTPAPAATVVLPPKLTEVVLHPSTAASALAGKAEVSYRLSRRDKVTLALYRCTARACTQVVRRTVSSPHGPSHVSVHGVTGHGTLADGHYRLTATPAGGLSTTVVLVVRG
jgi:N-acetylneuraminic acid mutarotase